ncbi:ORF6N domain-containing protein [Paracoccus jiaweipingae]|uniref:ORF6N domain-containing protein n=1 Tax=Paracoccus sp. p2-l61 TaxID=3366950 RepID=UPI003793B8BE
MTTTGHIPTIMDIQDKALLLPGRPQFWTSHHMAEFYQTTPQRVVEQMRRNPERFPEDFWFDLREDEKEVLVTQFAGPNRVNRGVLIGFTKGGALALSGVLRTPVANAVSVQIVRAIVAMEDQAIADARNMVARLQTEAMRKKPIFVMIELGMARGLSIQQMWRDSNYPLWKLEQAARDMLAMRLIDRLPDGMQAGLFDA